MQKHEVWLAFAKEDLKAAKLMLYNEEAILGPALYHMQQCAEKALKAFLVFNNQPIKRIHDLVELTHLCIEFDSSFKELLEDAAELNPYVSKVRYPDNYIIPDFLIAESNLKQSEKILKFVQRKIE